MSSATTFAMSTAIDYLLSRAKSGGLDLEILGHEKKSTAISFQQRKMDQFSFSETRQLGVRILEGKNEGVAYTESLDRESLEEMLAAARANAQMITREMVTELHGDSVLPKLDAIYNPALEQVAVEAKIQAAAELESMALDYDSRITNVAYTRYGDSSFEVCIANTRGLRGSYRTNSCYGYTRCLAQDKEGNVMGAEVSTTRDFARLAPREIARRAAERTLERMGAVRPDTGKYTVVFENRMAENLMELIHEYFSAKAVDEKTSPLTGKLGQKIFASRLTLLDDPFYTTAGGSRPFDEEGYPARPTPLVQEGVVTSFLTNSVLARKLGLPHTASASRSPSTDLDVSVSNVVVQSGTQSLAQLLSADSQVILVTDILGYAGFRATSGDFSLPVEGHLYTGGQRTVALKDFLLSGNILELLGQIEAIGNDVLPPVGNTVSPSLLVRDLNVAGRA
ncbi:MAG: TldD/PmbA family protein [Bdellovibrionales bacterium]